MLTFSCYFNNRTDNYVYNEKNRKDSNARGGKWKTLWSYAKVRLERFPEYLIVICRLFFFFFTICVRRKTDKKKNVSSEYRYCRLVSKTVLSRSINLSWKEYKIWCIKAGNSKWWSALKETWRDQLSLYVRQALQNKSITILGDSHIILCWSIYQKVRWWL